MTDDYRSEILAAVESILADHPDPDSAPDAGLNLALWRDLHTTGFDLLGVPEEAGGSGGTLGDLAAVLELAAAHGARVPLAEGAMLAGWLLAEAGIAVPAGPLTAALGEPEVRGSGHDRTISGRLEAVPWAGQCDHVAVLAREAVPGNRQVIEGAAPGDSRDVVAATPGDGRVVAQDPGGGRVVAQGPGDGRVVVLVPLRGPGVRIAGAQNLAGEPRDTVVLSGAEIAATAAAPSHVDLAALTLRGALARSAQIAGACRAVLESARGHVFTREQFGRPLARFQAVQQHLAVLAAEVAAVQVGAQAAVLAVERDAARAGLAIAAAKAGASAAAYTVAGIGHQLHGALGYSQEHRLGAATTRLWAWREEFGNEDHWHDRIAGLAAEAPAGGLWPLIAGDEPGAEAP